MILAFAIATTLLPTLSRLLIFFPNFGSENPQGALLLTLFCLGCALGPTIQHTVDLAVSKPLTDTFAMLIVALSGLAIGLPSATLHGVGLAAIGVRLWAKAASVAMNDATASGRRRDALIFGAVVSCIHFSSALGLLILGPAIEGFTQGSNNAIAFATLVTALSAFGIVLLTQKREAAAA